MQWTEHDARSLFLGGNVVYSFFVIVPFCEAPADACNCPSSPPYNFDHIFAIAEFTIQILINV